MKNYTVLHVKKGDGNGAALGHHIDRTEDKKREVSGEQSYKTSNPNLRHLNKEFSLFSGKKLSSAIDEIIKNNYTAKTKTGEEKAIKKDAVKHVDFVLSFSPEFYEKQQNKSAFLERWVEENKQFISDKYGWQNVARFTLHLDEKTPHLHVVVVPLFSEKKEVCKAEINTKTKKTIYVATGEFEKQVTLSAKKVVGNATDLRNLHTEYAEKMQCFGLKRGEDRKLTLEGKTHLEPHKHNAELEKTNKILKIRHDLLKDELSIVEKENEQIRAISDDLKKENEELMQKNLQLVNLYKCMVNINILELIQNRARDLMTAVKEVVDKKSNTEIKQIISKIDERKKSRNRGRGI